ncbi:hypothetical protein [Lysinibacillus sp. NPDC093688]|uniref:hypothetical protein n=1 Tax=Lysinibacillus sp. NPDC093688 TaxID=3390577 RepID=UPI003CFC2BB3
MIGVVGTAHVKIFDDNELNKLHIDQENLKVNILKSDEKSGNYVIKFFITIPYNSDYKCLNDYKSFVHPTLKQHIRVFIISTQIIEIVELGIQPIKHISQL